MFVVVSFYVKTSKNICYFPCSFFGCNYGEIEYPFNVNIIVYPLGSPIPLVYNIKPLVLLVLLVYNANNPLSLKY